MELRERRGYETHFRRGIVPPPKYKVSKWADTHRKLAKAVSAEPGPWRTSRTPFLKAIMDALSPNNGITKIAFMKATQVGGTECGNNWIGHTIDHAPAPMMMVLPTVELAKRSSRQRIKPMIDESPRLKSNVTPSKSREGGNTILSKEFPGGVLIMTGANSAVGLRSMPVCNLFLDEIDGYENDVDGEGNPIDIAEKRTDTFNRKKKIFYCSTPTEESNSKIEPIFLHSNQQYYYVPCPHCQEKQKLIWAQMKWKGQKSALQVWYECIFCKKRIDEHYKTWMLEEGEWVAESETEEKGLVGFHLNSLYSPTGWFTWEQAVITFFKAKAAEKRKDFDKMKTFTNTILGETWEESRGESVNEESLYSRREEYTAEVPMEAFILTAGADIQEDRIEIEVVGWGTDEESWGIEKHIIYGDTTQQTVWNDLDVYLEKEFLHASGNKVKILCTLIDSGYLTKMVYAFCKLRAARRVFAAKGAAGAGRPIIHSSGRPKGKDSRDVRLFILGVDEAKRILFKRLRYTETGPGYCHFPKSYNEEHFAQLTGEKLVKKYRRGFQYYEWQKTRPRNEALDMRVLAHGGLLVLNPNWSSMDKMLKESVAGFEDQKNAIAQGKIPPTKKGGQQTRRVRSRGLN